MSRSNNALQFGGGQGSSYQQQHLNYMNRNQDLNNLGGAGGGYDTSHDYGNPQNEGSVMYQNENNPANTSLVERFMQGHQDATLDKNAWVPDNKVNKCTKCNKGFTFLYRKHHCRICGNVFCNNCTLVKNVPSKGIQQNIRMCGICEKDLMKYNQSLMIKNNLLKVDANRQSQMHSDSSILQESPYQTGTVGAPKHHQNRQRDDSLDSREEQKDSNNFHSNFAQLTPEDLRQMEEYKRRVTILEGAEKGDINDYLRDVTEEEKTERTFSDIKSVAASNLKELSVKQRLKEYSTFHIQQIVSDLIKHFQIDQKKWGQKLLHFVQTAVDNVRPSSRLLNDSMNFNSFIKIKIINWEDNTRSAYVNGVVMSKNIADKRMKSNITNPSILLLRESVGTVRSEGNGGLTDIQSLVDQEDYWIQIIKQKLTQVKPSIIIVEKEMGYKILDVLREADITIITDLSHDQMKRIQRYTQTIIAPSYNVIDKSFVLGKCKSFRVEQPYTGSQMSKMNFNMDPYRKAEPSTNFVSKDRSLVFFEGTNSALGCTILISGNMEEELDELKKVKQALREMLKLARNVVLERAFLFQLNCNIPKPIYTEDGSLNPADSPFLVTRNIINRQTLVVSKVIMKKGIAGFNMNNAQGGGGITTTAGNLNVSQNIGTANFLNNNDESTIQQQPIDTVSPQVLQMARAAETGKVNENYVKTKIDSMCGCPKKEKMTFYLKEQDETIGKFLYNMSKMLINNCDQCKEPLFKHLIQYYHKEGCLEIQLELKQITQQANRAKDGTKSRDIIMRGECQHCKKIVTPDTVMSNTLFEYSRARFLEQFFYNGDRLINQWPGCNHRSLKDINRIFIMPSGFQITFTYIPLEVYQIEMIQPKRQETGILFKQEIELRKAKMIEFSSSAYQELKTRMQKLMDFMKTEKRSYVSKEMQKKLEQFNINLFIQPLKRIKERLSPLDPLKQQQREDKKNNTFEDDLTHMLNELQKPIQEVKTIFEAMFLERKILINFLTYSRLLEETAKIVCLLLALLRLRMIVINKTDQSQSLHQTNASYDGSMTADHRSENERPNSTLFKNLSGQFDRSQTPNLMRRPSHMVDHSLSDQASQAFSTQLNKGDMMAPPAFSFIEDFITMSDMRQFQNNMLTPNQGGQPTAQSKQQSTQGMGGMSNQQNIETVKMFVYNQFVGLFDKLQKKWGQASDFSNPYLNQDKAQASSARIDEEDKAVDQSVINRGSMHQNIAPKNQLANSMQNLTSLNLIPTETNQNPYFSYQQQWMRQLNCGFVTMPLGTDNVHIPLNDSNIGSIISFVLGSNIYKEAMIKQNYMDIGSKIKAPTKRPQFPGVMDPASSQDNLRSSILQAASNPNFQPQPSSGSHMMLDEAIKLYGKDDVFNYELSPHQIETELLCGERLYFQVKFSTEKKDLSLKMVKNGTMTKLKQTSMQFMTGKMEKVKVKRQGTASNTVQEASKLKRKEEIVRNDLQDKVCSQLPKDYMDKNNEFFMEQMGLLDSVVRLLNQAYINPNAQGFLKSASPMRNPLTQNEDNVDYQMVAEPIPTMSLGTPLQVDTSMTGHPTPSMQNINSTPTLRESMIQNMKSPQIGVTGGMTTPNIGGNPMMSPQLNNGLMNNLAMQDPQEFCNIRSPMLAMLNPHETLKSELMIQKVDYELKVFFPKKFEALRRFYCGSQYDFIESLIQTQEWTTVTGGKTKSKFYRSFDDKYVLKEIKKSEFKMFIEFAPQYFDYLCKSFFHNYPCALCKILGAYKIKITTYKNNQSKVIKKYIYITENLNFGIRPEDEPHIIRYDLKGSTLNRFVKKQLGANDHSRVVLHDNNFQLAFMGRPLPIRYTINRILHICINNDTLCLSKSNIVDYSLLTIIDTKRKKVRFGIIDYVQQYTLDKIFEGQFKRIINRGEVPTIVDPDKYKLRFKRAMKRYFIGMVTQEEKTIENMTKQEQLEHQLQQQMINEEHDSDEEDGGNELNETLNKTNILNETINAKHVHEGRETDHENILTGMNNTGSESHSQVISPALQ